MIRLILAGCVLLSSAGIASPSVLFEPVEMSTFTPKGDDVIDRMTDTCHAALGFRPDDADGGYERYRGRLSVLMDKFWRKPAERAMLDIVCASYIRGSNDAAEQMMRALEARASGK